VSFWTEAGEHEIHVDESKSRSRSDEGGGLLDEAKPRPMPSVGRVPTQGAALKRPAVEALAAVGIALLLLGWVAFSLWRSNIGSWRR
jgi:hypothetical protein